MLSKNTIARAAVTTLLTWRGFGRADFHTDEIMTYMRETSDGDVVQGTGFIASRIINAKKTGESHVVSLTEGRLSNITRALDAHTTLDGQERLLIIADIDATGHQVLICGFDYDTLIDGIRPGTAINRKTNGGLSFNFARLDALSDVAIISGVISA